MKKNLSTFSIFTLTIFTLSFVFAPVISMATAELQLDQQRFDVSNGFEYEVRLDAPTRLEWTLVKGDATYLLELDLPGKQTPAAGWKDFFTEKGWDIAQPNSLKITFTDGSTAILYADVIGNSGKVRFWIEFTGEKEAKKDEGKDKERDTKDKDEDKKGKDNKANDTKGKVEVQIKGKWYVWVNYSSEAVECEDLDDFIKSLSPGTYHIKAELKDDKDNVLSTKEEVITVKTEDGGVLPKTATPWPNVMLIGTLLTLTGILGRKLFGVFSA